MDMKRFFAKPMSWYIGSEWHMERKGLSKTVLDLDFHKLDKPHLVSTVVICVEDVQHLNGRESVYLKEENLKRDQTMEMGTARTPVDCYLELLVRQMIVGEKARCSIRTKEPSQEIVVVVTLKRILKTKEIQKLSVREMYDLAMRYKENGVAMFKKYPLFAHDYFARAAKCLLSFKKFDGLTLKRDGVAGRDMEALLEQIQTNLAASLLAEKRYEDVIYQTQFVETTSEPTEKSVYRRALAYYNLKEFEKAQNTIERLPNYKDKREFVNLEQRIQESWKSSNVAYKNLVQRMFS